jgi:hypothetical protein
LLSTAQLMQHDMSSSNSGSGARFKHGELVGWKFRQALVLGHVESTSGNGTVEVKPVHYQGRMVRRRPDHLFPASSLSEHDKAEALAHGGHMARRGTTSDIGALNAKFGGPGVSGGRDQASASARGASSKGRGRSTGVRSKADDQGSEGEGETEGGRGRGRSPGKSRSRGAQSRSSGAAVSRDAGKRSSSRTTGTKRKAPGSAAGGRSSSRGGGGERSRSPQRAPAKARRTGSRRAR